MRDLWRRAKAAPLQSLRVHSPPIIGVNLRSSAVEFFFWSIRGPAVER